MLTYETRKNFDLGPPPKLLTRPGEMVIANPNWICVEGSDPDTIIDAIQAFSRLGGHANPVDHDVALIRHEPTGLFGLIFSPQLSPFVFGNMTAWLGDPFIVEGASTACGWTRSGRENLRWLFQKDRFNKSEDTVLVSNDREDRLELYLLDGLLCPSSKAARGIEEPLLTGATVEPLANFQVVLDADRKSSNASFLVTRPRDYVWGSNRY